jgi:hypothetical protein
MQHVYLISGILIALAELASRLPNFKLQVWLELCVQSFLVIMLVTTTSTF